MSSSSKDSWKTWPQRYSIMSSWPSRTYTCGWRISSTSEASSLWDSLLRRYRSIPPMANGRRSTSTGPSSQTRTSQSSKYLTSSNSGSTGSQTVMNSSREISLARTKKICGWNPWSYFLGEIRTSSRNIGSSICSSPFSLLWSLSRWQTPSNWRPRQNSRSPWTLTSSAFSCRRPSMTTLHIWWSSSMTTRNISSPSKLTYRV